MVKKNSGALTAWWKARVKKSPGLVYILYAAIGLAAVLFYLIGSGIRCNGTDSQNREQQIEIRERTTEGRDALEQRMIEVLSKIRGAGRVDVLVTYETNGEIVTATIRQTDEDVKDANGTAGIETSRSVREVTEPATVETENGYAPIVLYEKEPIVRGVVVVAEGASDFSVRQKLQAAVHAATGIPIERIEVFEMYYGGT
jgi:stage III sporulation protein AG